MRRKPRFRDAFSEEKSFAHWKMDRFIDFFGFLIKTRSIPMFLTQVKMRRGLPFAVGLNQEANDRTESFPGFS